jgi:hypothetical protein
MEFVTSKEFEDYYTLHHRKPRVYRSQESSCHCHLSPKHSELTRLVHNLHSYSYWTLYSTVAMMAFLCYLFIVVVAALMHNVSGATSIRSHYYNGGRVKGETTNDQKRHLQEDQPRKTKKHAGNILLTLDQVVRLLSYLNMDNCNVIACSLSLGLITIFLNSMLTTVDRCFVGRNQS